LSAKAVLKVIYAPNKAFKDIAQNLKFTGPILVLILCIAAGTASQHFANSKIYAQQTTPSSTNINSPDLWTDDYKAWISNANVTPNNSDSLFGKNSIQFNTRNDTHILMKLNDTFSIDCNGNNNYRNLTFSTKWIQPSAQIPSNITLYLSSQSENDFFYRSITVEVARNGTWGNITVPLGPRATQWTNSSSQVTWSNITGFRMIAVWPWSTGQNLTVLIDKMFFRSGSFSIEQNVTGNNVSYVVFGLAANFILYWLIFSVVLFAAARIFKLKAELKTILIIIGYSLIALFVMQVAFSIFYASIPPIYVTPDSVHPESVYALTVLFVSYATILFPIWSIAITAFGMKAIFNLTTRRSIIAAIMAFFPYYLLILFVG
jgi:hypothetical protein